MSHRLEDHSEGLRRSPKYESWRWLLHSPGQHTVEALVPSPGRYELSSEQNVVVSPVIVPSNITGPIVGGLVVKSKD